MNIAITGGGTGGHLSVAQAVSMNLFELGNHLCYIGCKRGQEQRWFHDASYFHSKYFLDTHGIADKTLLTLPRAVATQLSAIKIAQHILREHKIERVFSVGGYAAAPASFAALLLRIPLFIHEQNAKIGLLNTLLRPFATAFYSSYLKNSPIKDYPLRDIYFQKRRIREHIQNILFMGGSLGASAINRLALRLAPALLERNIHIIHQCGERDFQYLQSEYHQRGIDVELFSFTSNLVDYMQLADFAISRAGASSLWELCANALPALFIPYPYAAKNHQFHNAAFLSHRNLATLMCETHIDCVKILRLIDDHNLIHQQSLGLAELIKSSGSIQIAKDIVDSSFV